MTRVEELLTELVEEQRQIRLLLERQVGPVIAEEHRQLLTAAPAVVKAHNKSVLAAAKERWKGRAA